MSSPGLLSRYGFTLTEVMIACGVFSLFLAGLFSLYRSGQSASGQAFWLQKTLSQLRNTTRHISQNIQKTSYPSTFEFPARIFENPGTDFQVHFSSRGTLNATSCVSVSGKSAIGTQFLRFTESYPEKLHIGTDLPATLTYHIYSLTEDGRILYHKYSENVTNADPSQMQNLARPTVPPPSSGLVEIQELVSDVESIKIGVHSVTASTTPIFVEIFCSYPRGKTKRSEQVTVVPNVKAFSHPSGGGW